MTDHAQLTRHPAVVECVSRIVEAKNTELQSYARIKRFALLPVDFMESGGALTPTQPGEVDAPRGRRQPGSTCAPRERLAVSRDSLPPTPSCP